MRRTDVRRSFGQLRFSPRPRRSAVGPQAHLAGQPRLRHRRRGDRRCRAARRPASSASTSSRAIRSRSSTRASTSCCRRRSRSRPASSCRPAATPPRPAASSYTLGQQRPRLGPALGGDRHALRRHASPKSTYSGRWGVVPRFSIEPSVTLNWVQLPYGDFTAHLVELALHGDAERAHADQQPGAVQRRRAAR